MAERSNKGNPASKRMTNSRLKERRARSWARGQRRKAERVKAQEERAAANRERRESGQDTPWQAARKERARRRAEDPRVNKRREELRAA